MLDVILLGLKQGGGVLVNGDGGDLVTLRDFIHNILTHNHFTEDCMLAIEVRCGQVSDEKLAAIGVRSGVGHGENSCLGVLQRAVDLIGKTVSWATRTGASWVASLNHEIGNDAVKCHAVVISTLSKIEEIGGRDRDLRCEKPGIDVADAGVNGDFDVRHAGDQTQEPRVLQPKLEARMLAPREFHRFPVSTCAVRIAGVSAAI
jgi:hypothetical protein